MKGRARRVHIVIRSIRYTLTLWYVGVITAILCLFGWVLYANVDASLNRDVNKVLASQSASVASTVAAFWQAERAAPGLGPGNWIAAPSDTLPELIDAGRLPELVTRWAEKTGRLETVQPIRLLDRGGRPLAETAGFTQIGLRLTEVAVAEAKQGHDVYETLQSSEGRIRLMTHPVVEGKRVFYFVQAAASLSQADASLAGLRLWLLWLIPSTLFVTGAVGWFLANTALRPVGHMITQAQRIGAEHLDERLDVPRSGDELEQLAVTFNHMLARLEGAFRRLRQFSAAASHELRTPLTVMKGELEVALRKPRDSEEYQRVLRTHLETIEEMAHTVEELLALARSEAVEGAIERRPVELGGLVHQISERWKPLATAKAVRVEVPVHESVWVHGEQRLLERLISNLLDNAIRHTPSNGLVIVQSERWENQACLKVKDTGPGIPPEEFPHLFDRFFKPRSSDAKALSTGLGLGLCRWIVEAHRGRIEVASPPQQGAIFTVWLPLTPPPGSPPPCLVD
jgi:heavy metal sensor kinase